MKINIVLQLFLIVSIICFSAVTTLAAKKSKRVYISGVAGSFFKKNVALNDYTNSESGIFEGSLGSFKITGVRDFFTMEASLNDSFSFISAVGLYLSKNFRIEAEYAYRHSSMQELTGTSNNYFISEEGCGPYHCLPDHNDILLNSSLVNFVEEKIDINIKSHSFMANVFYEIPVGEKFKFYTGGGIGGARLIYKISVETEIVDNVPLLITLTEFKIRNTPPQYIDEPAEILFAFQFMGGASYELDDSFALILGYRYFNVGNSLSSNGIEAGFRYNF